ncbi:hypothetical protein CDD82_7689 [Ophiocordyceps australis]|uniref:Glycoprotease family protein n=1 Tax=Ophiocordyceps australis TaxID=1399860 RepID=A0A2C5ZPY5_9HYPO|nr:hypothetical protein CDD82_7689 [Ophiocordyceps australis]
MQPGIHFKARLPQDEEWEEWEDESVITPIETEEQVVAQPIFSPSASQSRTAVRSSIPRLSTPKFKRLRSRHGRRTQNAKAGIKLITDMSVFKRGNQVECQDASAKQKPVKFVDATALRALEGEPSSASVGSWNWLKKLRSPSSETASPAADKLSPDDRPIVIGISLPSEGTSSRDASQRISSFGNQDAPWSHETVRQQQQQQQHKLPPETKADRGLLGADLLPNTKDVAAWLSASRTASSIYSQATAPGAANRQETPPPVPALPIDYRRISGSRINSCCASIRQHEEEGDFTPCTLFEEDGRRATMGKTFGLSPSSATSRSHGWWDHVVSPFLENKFSVSSRRLNGDSSPRDEVSPCSKASSTWYFANGNANTEPVVVPVTCVRTPIVCEPVSGRHGRARLQSQTAVSTSRPQASFSQTRPALTVKMTADCAEKSQRELPPPYSPPLKPPKTQGMAPRRFRAAFPTGHPLHVQFPPSPGPISPGVTANMESQGSTHMTNITVDASPWETALPPRPPGTYLPREHVYDAARSNHGVERQRRRHEKEDAMARRAGGFWRGRACIPATGCLGRSGREGRKRRRVWMASCAALMLLLILAIVLAIVLGRRHRAAHVHSIWVNLTDFPPMPTGVLTVVGPDNKVAKSVCTEPSTLWSCSLPKEQHATVAPYKANQPTVMMQIEWDSSAQGDGPKGPTARGAFHAIPAAPSVEELWFLGNTTDGIQSEQKAGEPTPFYISLGKWEKETVAKATLDKRTPGTRVGNESLVKLLPRPEVEQDGSPAPAVMLPNAAQQPVRLYDRGLATEHYGFYTHFKRSIMVKSVKVGSRDDKGGVDMDQEGGCAKNEADYVVTWGETRVLVQMWTRRLQLRSASLLRGDESDNKSLTRPGTMPYPVTITLDTHGGNRFNKLVWDWPIDRQGRVQGERPELLVNNMGVGGTWINARGSGLASMGGYDGGSGGCQCQWVNWVERREGSD